MFWPNQEIFWLNQKNKLFNHIWPFLNNSIIQRIYNIHIHICDISNRNWHPLRSAHRTTYHVAVLNPASNRSIQTLSAFSEIVNWLFSSRRAVTQLVWLRKVWPCEGQDCTRCLVAHHDYKILSRGAIGRLKSQATVERSVWAISWEPKWSSQNDWSEWLSQLE
jgi:hypothetical protein